MKKRKNQEAILIAENDYKRSEFIYNFLQKEKYITQEEIRIPKVIMQYWHSSKDIPKDVLNCIESWKTLKDQGFKFKLFDDVSAKIFIKNHLSKIHLSAYLKCHHPAMRCDYFRLCYLYIYGGLYVDADELFLDKKINSLFTNKVEF